MSEATNFGSELISSPEEILEAEKMEQKLNENIRKDQNFKKAKERHPHPVSKFREMIHEASESEATQEFLNERAKNNLENSGIKEMLEKLGKNNKEITIADIGAGKQHILKEMIGIIEKSDPEIKIKTVGMDPMDYASKKVSESEKGEKMNSVFAKGEFSPINENSADVVSAFYSFHELNKEQQEKMLAEMKRIVKENGRIIIIDDLSPESKTEKFLNQIRSSAVNVKIDPYNVSGEKEMAEFFKENELEIEYSRIFKENEEDGKEPRHISYILKKAAIAKEKIE